MPSHLGRTYHDPLHGAITLAGTDPVEALLIDLIDTPAFQRLRRIRQLGPASLTFHGAESSRFTHSLGVMAIARRAFDRLAHDHPSLQPYRATVLCAALLHDVGHGPFSHTAEDIFGSQHEQWTVRIIQTSAPLYERLAHFQPDLVASLQQVYAHQHPVPLVWQLVSSQLDCDRLDYLMRDSHSTGAAYGQLDLDRILMAMQYDPVTQQLVVAPKGIAAIEHYLIVRHFMYAQVYTHPKNLAATWMLTQIFQRAQQLLHQQDLAADPTVTAWLRQSPSQPLSLADYLDADDTVLSYHIQRWRSHPDPILADLCRRYRDRDLFKASNISSLTATQQQAILAQLRQRLTEANLDPQIYAGVRHSSRSGYSLYQQGIKVNTLEGLRELSTLSPIVQTLTQRSQQAWLIHPRDQTVWVQQACATMMPAIAPKL